MAQYTGTISSLVYDETVEVEQTTPLGTFTNLVPVDMLTVTVQVKGVPDQSLTFSPEAVGNRMAVYEIDDIVAAVESIVREVVFSWDPTLAPPPDPTLPMSEITGGLHPEIAILWTEEASAQATEVLDPLADRIYAARDASMPAPPDDTAKLGG